MVMEQPVTLRDIAEACGVSVMSVSRAMRGDRAHLSTELMGKICATAEAMGYDPSMHASARRLANRRTGQHVLNHVVGMFFPGEFETYSYFMQIFRGMLRVFREHGYALLSDFLQDLSAHPLPGVFMRGEVDGVIVLGRDADLEVCIPQLRKAVQAHPCPMVTLISPIAGCSSVLADDMGGGYAATAHLLELGHRHIGHFCPQDSFDYPLVQRREGSRQAYRDRGLDPEVYFHAINVPLYEGDHAYLVGEMMRAIQERPEITAYLARNDVTAQVLADALRQLGKRIPEDVSLIGYDDSDPLLDSCGQNMLTTVRVPLIELGREAAHLMIRRVTGNVPHDVQIVVPTTLVVRGSTAAPCG